jgi:hypothetical protein
MPCKLGHKQIMNFRTQPCRRFAANRDGCAIAGRNAADITLIAVSKTFGAEDILPVEAGKPFGEAGAEAAAVAGLAVIRAATTASSDWSAANQQSR